MVHDLTVDCGHERTYGCGYRPSPRRRSGDTRRPARPGEVTRPVAVGLPARPDGRRCRRGDQRRGNRPDRPRPGTRGTDHGRHSRGARRGAALSLTYVRSDLMDADAAAETNAEVIARIARDREPVELTMDDILAARDEGRR